MHVDIIDSISWCTLFWASCSRVIFDNHTVEWNRFI